MAGRSDPLSILRDFHSNKKKFEIRDDLVIFDDIAFKKDVLTNYKNYSYDKESEQSKPYYSLECLVFFVQHDDLTHPNYMKEATKQGVDHVTRMDRRELLDYLSGKSDASSKIDKMAKIALPVPFKRTAEEPAPPIRRPKIDTERSIRDREKLVARLEAPKDQSATVSTDKIASNSLSSTSAIPLEELAAIRAKRLANKRRQIRPDDDVPGADDFPTLIDTDTTDLHEILSRERVCRTRNDITKGTKDLTSRLAPIFAMIKSKEDGRAKKDTNSAPLRQSIPVPKAAVVPAQYSRYDQEQFTKADVTDFGINTTSSYRGAPTGKTEVASGKSANGTLDAAVTPDSNRQRSSKTPIIIVPKSQTSLINALNAMDLLQNNQFVAPEVKKAELAKDGRSGQSDMLINWKKPDGSIIPIRVMDEPSKLAVEKWDQVVAVFVQGQAWQFKGWPWSANPVDIFDKIKAFHVKYDDMPTEKNVAAWNVTLIPISRTKRHLDRASLLKFWEALDKFVVKNKPYLRW